MRADYHLRSPLPSPQTMCNCVPTGVSARHICYLSPTQPSISRIAWKSHCCSFLLLFRGTARPGAWLLRLSRHGCSGGDAGMGIVCTTRIHQEHRVQTWRPIFWLPPPPKLNCEMDAVPSLWDAKH